MSFIARFFFYLFFLKFVYLKIFCKKFSFCLILFYVLIKYKINHVTSPYFVATYISKVSFLSSNIFKSRCQQFNFLNYFLIGHSWYPFVGILSLENYFLYLIRLFQFVNISFSNFIFTTEVIECLLSKATKKVEDQWSAISNEKADAFQLFPSYPIDIVVILALSASSDTIKVFCIGTKLYSYTIIRQSKIFLLLFLQGQSRIVAWSAWCDYVSLQATSFLMQLQCIQPTCCEAYRRSSQKYLLCENRKKQT